MPLRQQELFLVACATRRVKIFKAPLTHKPCRSIVIFKLKLSLTLR